MSRLPFLLATAALFVLISPQSHFEDWPAWLGPGSNGTSLETHVPMLWSSASHRVWQTELPRKGHASLVSANGLVYFLNDDGVMRVAKPGPEFELIAKNELGERCFPSPAISDGNIFIRGDKHLFCIGQ